MTNISPEAERAREEARGAGGQFGEQHHSAPEATLVAERPHDAVLSDLSDMYNHDSYVLETEAKTLRMESFIADARAAVPSAVSAQFSWDYPEESSARLVFDYYLDEDGNAVEADDGGFPDITDFHFDETRQARQFGFVESDDTDGATIDFVGFSDRSEEKARAQLAASKKVEHRPHERELRALLFSALNGSEPIPAERLSNLSDHDIEQVEAIFEDALRSTANYLRHS